MKKQFLFSAIAVLLAVGGATASNRFADIFYPAGDSTCSRAPISQPCTIGTQVPCLDDNNIQYYYRPDGTTQCLELNKDQ